MTTLDYSKNEEKFVRISSRIAAEKVGAFCTLFDKIIEHCGSITLALKAVGISTTTYYSMRSGTLSGDHARKILAYYRQQVKR